MNHPLSIYAANERINRNSTKFEKSLSQLISDFDLEITVDNSQTTINDMLRRVSDFFESKHEKIHFIYDKD